MTAADTARTNYEAARAEIIERLGHREHAIEIYLAAAAAIVTVAYGSDLSPESKPLLLGLIAYLSFAVAILTWQHTKAIHLLAEFCRTKIHPFLDAASEGAPQMDVFLKGEDTEGELEKTRLRVVATLFLISGPALFGLIAAWSNDNGNRWLYLAFSTLFALFGAIITVNAFSHRWGVTNGK